MYVHTYKSMNTIKIFNFKKEGNFPDLSLQAYIYIRVFTIYYPSFTIHQCVSAFYTHLDINNNACMNIHTYECTYKPTEYRKWGKIRWAKLSCFSRLSGDKYRKSFSVNISASIVLNNEHLQPRQRKSISVKTSMALKPRIFSPANLSSSTVIEILIIHAYKFVQVHICTQLHACMCISSYIVSSKTLYIGVFYKHSAF